MAAGREKDSPPCRVTGTYTLNQAGDRFGMLVAIWPHRWILDGNISGENRVIVEGRPLNQ